VGPPPSRPRLRLCPPSGQQARTLLIIILPGHDYYAYHRSSQAQAVLRRPQAAATRVVVAANVA